MKIANTYDRLKRIEMNPVFFLNHFDRKITLSGLPGDAEYVRSYYDAERDLFNIVVRSELFDQVLTGYGLLRIPILVTVE